MMQLLFRTLSKPRRQHQHSHRRGIVDLAAIKHVRDRGLDHVVEREKHLKPVLNIKNLIKAEPSKSVPISIISQHKDALCIPSRPIELIRKYPSVFEEYLPGGIGIQPHIKLTPQVLDLDSEEQLVYESESYRRDVGERLFKLLMVSRIDRIPLKILDLIKWDLGLPQDYVESVVPEFPDCFRVIEGRNSVHGLGSDLVLELVCWSNELAVPVMEKKVKLGEKGVEKGEAMAFPMKFSRGFELDKKLKKWYDDWQKLPYISPYENAMHLRPSSDESDKWAVGVIHEIINLFISKKVERELMLGMGEWLGIRSRFKRALLHHPGIFYLSSKIGTYTVVLKDAYKRGLLIEKNPMMNIRNRYIHLMNTVTEERKASSVPGGSKQQEKKLDDKSKGQEDDKDSVEINDLGSDFENDSDDDHENDEAAAAADDDGDEDEDEEVGEGWSQRTRRDVRSRTGRTDKKNLRGDSKNIWRERSVEKTYDGTKGNFVPKDSERSRRAFSRGEKHTGRREIRMEKNLRGDSKNSRRERNVEKIYDETNRNFVPKDSERSKRAFSRGEKHTDRRETSMEKNSSGSSKERSTLKRKRRLLTEKRTAAS